METGFFRLLWRFNALAIAATALLVLGSGAVIGFGIANEILFGRKTTRVVNVDPTDQSVETSRHFGYPRGGASGVLRISLLQDQSYDYRLSSKDSRSNTVNVVFVEIDTGQTSWLLPDNNALILSEHSIAREDGSDRPARSLSRDERENRTQFIVYEIVRADSSGDGFLSASDRVEIAVGLPDNSHFEVLYPDVTTLEWVDRTREDSATILFTDADGTKLARLSLIDLSVSEIARLHAPKPD